MTSASHILEKYYESQKRTPPANPHHQPDLFWPARILRQTELYPGIERLEQIEAIAEAELEFGLLAGPHTAP